MQEPETGRLKEISEEEYETLKNKPRVAIFRVGQIVEVNGGKFRVRKITKKDLILRGVPYNVTV